MRQHVVSPSELSSLRDLELLARTTVEGLRQGLHRSPFHGYSAEFSQYRHYRPGDDLKYVDWKAFARTNRLYSRQFRETTNLAALLVIDASGSMAYPSDAPSKFALARGVAAVLGTLVIDQGDAAGLVGPERIDPRTSRTVSHYIPPRSGRHHLHLFLAELARLECGGVEGVAPLLERAARLLRRRGMIVVISDFYEEERALVEMRRLARMGHEVIAVHVMAREELQLPHGRSLEIEDLESGATLLTNPEAVAAAYRSNVQSFLTRMRQAIVREGMEYVQLTTGEPLEPRLRQFLLGRRVSA